jgi:hypothetical protein
MITRFLWIIFWAVIFSATTGCGSHNRYVIVTNQKGDPIEGAAQFPQDLARKWVSSRDGKVRVFGSFPVICDPEGLHIPEIANLNPEDDIATVKLRQVETPLSTNEWSLIAVDLSKERRKLLEQSVE